MELYHYLNLSSSKSFPEGMPILLATAKVLLAEKLCVILDPLDPTWLGLFPMDSTELWISKGSTAFQTLSSENIQRILLFEMSSVG